jgi:Na+-translocating ferredoxin:NAD+ oxidoreductase RnfE subunit
MLAIALGGSVVFALFTITVRDASQIPLLASGAVVLGIAFCAVAAYAARSTWHAGIDGRNGRAVALALAGGLAAIIGAGCLAGAIILFMLARPPA